MGPVSFLVENEAGAQLAVCIGARDKTERHPALRARAGAGQFQRPEQSLGLAFGRDTAQHKLLGARFVEHRNRAVLDRKLVELKFLRVLDNQRCREEASVRPHREFEPRR